MQSHYCHVRTQSMAIYSTRNMSSVRVISCVKKWLIVDTRKIAESDVFLRGKSIWNLYWSLRTTKSCLPQNTTAHFSGFNSRYDTLLGSAAYASRAVHRAPCRRTRVCVTYVRPRVRVCARTCARMQPRKAFLFRDERRRRCRVSDKHEQHACLRKISGMSLHTPPAVMP